MKKYRRLYVSWHWRVMQSLTENWLLVPKVTWGIWWILLQTVALKICTLLYYFCWKDIMFELKKKIQRSYCHNTQEWCTIWRGTDLCFEKWHEELYEFWKYQNLHFSGLFLTKVYNVWAKKVQKSYVWLYWRSMQTLKGSDL